MNTIPQIATVAELQRNYRPLINKIKKTGEPLIVVSNGKPDVVILEISAYQAQSEALKNLEEINLARELKESHDEIVSGKKTLLKSLKDLR